MHTLYQVFLTLHVAAGFIGLTLFWFPALSKKGSRAHKRIGSIFVNAMLLSGTTAIMMTLLLYSAPLAVRDALDMAPAMRADVVHNAYRTAHLLVTLGFLLLANTRHAVLCLKLRSDRAALRNPLHLGLVIGLLLCSAHLGLRALTEHSILYTVFSILGIISGSRILHYVFKAQVYKGEWVIQHISNILGAGIAAHTAFFVFGGSSLISQWMPTEIKLMLWLAPGIIGGIAISLLSRQYARKFNAATTPLLQETHASPGLH